MGIFERVAKFYNFWYYQYILHTGLYMLEIWERRIFTSLLVAFFLMASYTGYLFLPGHLHMLGHFIQLYIFGQRPELSPTSTAEDSDSTAQLHS